MIVVDVVLVVSVIAALVGLRRLQVRAFDRRAEQMDDQLGNEIPPWDHGTDQIDVPEEVRNAPLEKDDEPDRS